MKKRQDRFEWTQEYLEALKTRYQTDGPTRLAKEFGITMFAVVAKARRLGIKPTRKRPPRGFRWTDEMTTALKERYVSEGGDKLAQEFGLSLDTVRRMASGLGLHTIAGHARAGRLKAERNNRCNIHYFDEWSSSMAYILGFLFADGSVSKKLQVVTINLAIKDEAVLWFIKKELKSRQPISYIDGKLDPRTGKTNQKQARFLINSTVVAEKLGKLGLHPRKTFNDDPFPNVPDEVAADFVRGYLDGDGWICINCEGGCSLGFIGSPKFVLGLRDLLIRLTGISKGTIQNRKNKTDCTCATWSGSEDLRKLQKFLYPEGHGFCLDRKRKKLFDWLSEPHGTRTSWTPFEDEMITRFFHVMRPGQLGALIGKSAGAVVARAKSLKASSKGEIL